MDYYMKEFSIDYVQYTKFFLSVFFLKFFILMTIELYEFNIMLYIMCQTASRIKGLFLFFRTLPICLLLMYSMRRPIPIYYGDLQVAAFIRYFPSHSSINSTSIWDGSRSLYFARCFYPLYLHSASVLLLLL